MKQLLVALDGSPHSASAAQLAFALAAPFEARVTGIHVLDLAQMDASFIADLSGSVGFQPFLNLTAELREALKGIGEAVVADFEEKRRAAGIAGGARIEEGLVVARLLEAAESADLLLLGTRGVGGKKSASLGGHADHLLRRIRRPAVVCPRTYTRPSRILAAFDDSEKASRALALGAAIAAGLGVSLEVLTVSPGAHEADRRRQDAERIVSSTGASHRFLTASGHPEESILSAIGPADLVAMGAHGHGRIIEMVLGSTTERILRSSPAPVLCAP
jgi:nucleotide-binding universal stress UspA family protein